ncbi:YHS domain-containing protein [Pedobacter caeni]|uniref:YHS domain-containing protein n=2 Tax=Pedobacter caeni TaxID=288992 RepID=A0A1M5J7P4_9SPHI|nr:YHS domain-containing protein [Pedobacter caeni]
MALLFSTTAFKSNGNPVKSVGNLAESARNSALFAAQQVQTDTLKTDAKDPVCGMKVKKGATLTHTHDKTTYGFCSKSCKKSFVSNPDKYLKK